MSTAATPRDETSPGMVPDLAQKDLLDAYFDANREAVDYVQQVIVPIFNGQLNLSPHEQAVVGTFYRMHALADSLTRLNKLMDFNTVAIIARSLYEVFIDLKLLIKPSEQDLARFAAFPRIERFRKAQKIREFQNSNPGVESSAFFDIQMRKSFLDRPGKKDEIEQEVKKLWGRVPSGDKGWPDHWTGMSLRERAKSFGAIYEQEYLEIYSFLSWYAHAGASGYAGFSEQSLESVYGISLNLARKMYVAGIIVCGKVFPLSQALAGFSQVTSFLAEAPKHFLIDLELERQASGAASRLASNGGDGLTS